MGFKVITFFYYSYELIPEKYKFMSHNLSLDAYNSQLMVQKQGSSSRNQDPFPEVLWDVSITYTLQHRYEIKGEQGRGRIFYLFQATLTYQAE